MQYTQEQLYETNLHSLQRIGREIGVYAPTRLKKKELIREILLIDSGEKLPCAPIKKGRPPKRDLAYIPYEPASVEPAVVESEDTVEDEQEKALRLREQVKQEIIVSILKEIEKKLNKLL